MLTAATTARRHRGEKGGNAQLQQLGEGEENWQMRLQGLRQRPLLPSRHAPAITSRPLAVSPRDLTAIVLNE